MKRITYLLFILLGLIVYACGIGTTKEKDMNEFEKGTFGYDLNYFSPRNRPIVLSGDDEKAQIIVSAKYQAKVFTSTVDGLSGKSLGYVGYKALDSETFDEHMNAYGGENRFWLGPEGGQYSIYFEPGKEQVFANWHTPEPIDIERWDVVGSDRKRVDFIKYMRITNYLGTQFSLCADRTIELLETSQAAQMLDVEIEPGLGVVAYVTRNQITNLDDFEWTKETGAICIWILDMFIPAPKAVTVIPFVEGSESKLGKIATTDYFGEIPGDRLQIREGVIYLKTDGKFRSKLGLNSKRTKSVAGNYDSDAKRLTIVTFDVDKDAIYLNQEWNPAKNPLTGDAMNAYNDGPLEDGSIMGPFFELESVSPAAFLRPNESLSHQHAVFNFVGDEEKLTKITEKLLGVSIQEIKAVF
jgi:hypothetical protein